MGAYVAALAAQAHAISSVGLAIPQLMPVPLITYHLVPISARYYAHPAVGKIPMPLMSSPATVGIY